MAKMSKEQAEKILKSLGIDPKTGDPVEEERPRKRVVAAGARGPRGRLYGEPLVAPPQTGEERALTLAYWKAAKRIEQEHPEVTVHDVSVQSGGGPEASLTGKSVGQILGVDRALVIDSTRNGSRVRMTAFFWGLEDERDPYTHLLSVLGLKAMRVARGPMRDNPCGPMRRNPEEHLWVTPQIECRLCGLSLRSPRPAFGKRPNGWIEMLDHYMSAHPRYAADHGISGRLDELSDEQLLDMVTVGRRRPL